MLIDQSKAMFVRDLHNQPVPENLQDIFAGLECIKRWSKRMQEMIAQLGSLAMEPYGRAIDYEWARVVLLEVVAHVADAAPARPCRCEAFDLSCELCHGSRWYNRADYYRTLRPRHGDGDLSQALDDAPTEPIASCGGSVRGR